MSLIIIDNIYKNKPIKYILNSHHHGHSLSTILPFIEIGAKLVTAKENIKVYNKKGFFGSKTAEDYLESIIQISSDTVLLAETENPIEVLYLKKSDYKSIPTDSYLFFNFPKHKLLATSCMVYLKDIDKKYWYKGIMYSNRLINVNEIITNKNLDVQNTLQSYKFRVNNGLRKPPIFPIAHLQNVLKHSWSRTKLSEHFQNMSYEELSTKKDSILSYLIECQIYQVVLNHAVYELINKKEYKKAVALAHILVLYKPDRINEVDTLGEAYYNNGQLDIAKHYDNIIKKSKSNSEELGLNMWVKNQQNRLNKKA